MKRNRNQTTATLPAAAKKAGESKPGKKLKPGPKEKRKQRRSTPEQRKAVRAKAQQLIDRYGLQMCAANDQEYRQHSTKEMRKLSDVSKEEFVTEGDAANVRKSKTKVYDALKQKLESSSDAKKASNSESNLKNNPKREPTQRFAGTENRILSHNLGYAAGRKVQSNWQPMLFCQMGEFEEMARYVRGKSEFKARIAAKAAAASATEEQKQDLMATLKNACNNKLCEMEPKLKLQTRQAMPRLKRLQLWVAESPSYDHTEELSGGGNNCILNGQVLCFRCNCYVKNDRRLWNWASRRIALVS